MQFKARNLRLIAEMVVGNIDHQWFQYRSSFVSVVDRPPCY
ncbi:hypothetical protein J2Y58_003607 [Sphingomonas sp. BE138]|nr:hypothetical protein [Sphingomonas sp. BE138]